VPSRAPANRRSAAPSAVRFEGTPTAVSALVNVPGAQRSAIKVDVMLPGLDAAQPVQALTAPASETRTLVRLVLAAGTPPGAYDATVHTLAGDIPAVVLVKERPHLTLTPTLLRITAPPGGEIEQNLTAFNAGNVPCRIGRTYGFGLFDSEGLDKAVGAGLLAKAAGLERLATMADSLADSHGGLVRMTVREGAGVLNPGEDRQLVMALRFSDRLKPGLQYVATWALQDLRTAVLVDVVKPSVATREPR
jgi:hypothetical protein